MNGFRRLQKRLTEEGWYVGWGGLCCQSCAWATLPDEHEEGPFKGQEIDFSKVLFNHEQDCEDYNDDYDDDDESFEDSPMKILSPEEQSESLFCFDGSKSGVENLTAIIPIIEECGCEIKWSGRKDTRPEISWRKK